MRLKLLSALHKTVCFALVITVDYNLKQKRKRGEEVTVIGGFKIAHFSRKKQAMINDKAEELWVFSTIASLALFFRIISQCDLQNNDMFFCYPV